MIIKRILQLVLKKQ